MTAVPGGAGGGKRADGGVALVATPAGQWRIGWRPELASFTAEHVREVAPGERAGRVGRPGRVDHQIGVAYGGYPSPTSIEEGLGFALPQRARDALGAQRADRPALAAPRGMELGVGEPADRPRGVDTFPSWSSVATLPAGGSFGWGLALEADRQRLPAAADLAGGVTLEVLGATPDPGTDSDLVAYRLSKDQRVVFAGEDVRAPAGADLTADDSLRALLAVIIDGDVSHRPRPLSGPQRAFLDAHPALGAVAAGPQAGPYPPGTRVAVEVNGQRHPCRVVYPVLSRHEPGDPLAYAWRPHVASLIGHPWRQAIPPGPGGLGAETVLIAPPATVTEALAEPRVDLPGPGQVLLFGTTVAVAHPETGRRMEATVLRAFGGTDGIVYQVEPHTPARTVDPGPGRPDDTGTLLVGADQLAVLAGTWWPGQGALMEARKAAGLAVLPGEILAGEPGRRLSVLAETDGDAPAARGLSPAQREAALLVGVERAPPMVTVDLHGEVARVGDPTHGWMVVPAEQLMAAMGKPEGDLRAIVAAGAPQVSLAGDESLPTLAALAATHAPDRLHRPAGPRAGRLTAVPDGPAIGL